MTISPVMSYTAASHLRAHRRGGYRAYQHAMAKSGKYMREYDNHDDRDDARDGVQQVVRREIFQHAGFQVIQCITII